MSNEGHRKGIFYGWVVVAVCFVTMGLGYGIWYSFTVFFLAVLDEFHWSRADAALAFSVFVIVHGLSGPLLGVLVERFSMRIVMSFGAVLLAVSLAGASQSREPWQFYATFSVLSSVGVNFIGAVPSYTVINRWFVKRRGFAIGVASAGIGTLSIFALVPFNQYLLSTIGWRSAYLVVAAIMLVAVPPLAYFVSDWPKDKGLLPDDARGQDASPQAQRAASDFGVINRRWAGTDWTLRRATRTWQFWALFITFFLAPMTNQTIFVHQTAYFIELGHEAMLAATIVGLVGLSSIPGKIGFGWLSDRIGREASYSFGVAFIVTSLLLLLLLPAHNGVPTLILYAISYGLGYSVHASMGPSVVADMFNGRRYAVIYSVLAIASNGGSALGAWAAGLIYDLTGAYAMAFVISIGISVTGALGLWLVGPRRIRLAAGPAARAAKRLASTM